PSQGLPTKTLALASFTAATPVWAQASRAGYDTSGRITDAFDALDRHTTTSYTPATGGPVTQTTVTNPAGHVTTTSLDDRGSPTSIVDPNLKTTTAAYDPLGRLTKVWLPGRSTTLTPNLEYGYLLRTTANNAISTKRLGPTGNQITSYQLYDGL